MSLVVQLNKWCHFNTVNKFCHKQVTICVIQRYVQKMTVMTVIEEHKKDITLLN